MSEYSNAVVFFLFSVLFMPPPQRLCFSALLAKVFCHEDGMFDPELNVLLQAVPPTDMYRYSLSVLRSFSAVFLFFGR